jgi:hypothetical protein
LSHFCIVVYTNQSGVSSGRTKVVFFICPKLHSKCLGSRHRKAIHGIWNEVRFMIFELAFT